MPESNRTAGRSPLEEGGRLFSVAILCALISGALLAADAPDAQEILHRAEQVRSPDLDYAVDFRLDVHWPHSSWEHRSAAYSIIAHGKDQSLVVMREPTQFYPGTLLIDHGRYWLLLPRAKRPIELSARSVLNGDISNGDLARGNLSADYSPRLEGDGTVEGQPCWILDLTRTRRLALHPRIRAWIAKESYRPLKFEYYGATLELLKTAFYEDYREGPLGVRSMKITVRHAQRLDEKSTMTFSELRPIDLSDVDFDRPGMQALRDAALERQDNGGDQLDAEGFVSLVAPEAR